MAETIGQQLKQSREARFLTIRKVVEETRIRAHYIEAMEADNFEALPSPVQARGFLRLYASFLGLDMDELITRQRIEAPAASPAHEIPSVLAMPEPVLPVAETPQVFPPAEKKKARRKKKPVPESEPNPADEPAAPAEPPTAEQEPPGPAEPAATTPTSSQLTFAAIGRELRSQREALSLTLDEIERHTHVRKHYLQRLEEGEFDRLPSSVQARGMLNNYAHFLDLDVDAILLKFADGLQAQHLERQVEVTELAQEGPFQSKVKFPLKLPFLAVIRRYLTTDLLVGGGLILFLIIFAIWGTSRIVSLRTGTTPQPSAPSISDILIASPQATVTATLTAVAQIGESSQAPGTTPVIALPTGGTGSVQIILVATQSTWVSVTVDGTVKFQGILALGNAYSYEANTQIEVLTGNGAAVSITYNQNNLGPMGTLGEVVDHIYTANGILNPTPTFTPTSTQSPVPTWTSSHPTPTSRYSPTPTPSATSIIP